MTRRMTSNVQPAQKKQVSALLDELCGLIEELLLAGLTTASKSTIERIDLSFKEASRMQLLRLGSTLRIANEEVVRFTSNSSQFSAKRLSFFLGRAWLLATRMKRAIDTDDTASLERLMATPGAQPIERVKFVTIGITKRVMPGAFAAFDFRLRVLEASAVLSAGESLVWSCVFPMRAGLDLPAEAFLHLPQKQKFKPSALLEKKTCEFAKCAISRQPASAARLMLGEASTFLQGDAFADWAPFWKWDLAQAFARLTTHKATPLDLDVELQEEVFIDEWEPGEQRATEDGYDLLAFSGLGLPFEARLDRGPSGDPLTETMTKFAKLKKSRPPIYGLAHYESCKIIFQPLTALGKEGPEYLTVSKSKISQAELVKAMKFT